MKRLLIILSLFVVLTADAQYNFELGVQLGGSNYLGDIGGKRGIGRDFILDMHLQQTRFTGGVYGRYRFNKRFAALSNFSVIHLNDKDSESQNPARVARNLNFRNRIYELGARAEVTIFYDNDVSGRGFYNPDYWFYVFAGVSGYYHKPQAKLWDSETQQLVGDWVDLPDLKTEGVEYSQIGVAIPLGIGMHFTFNRSWRFGWELSYRTTFTDYLDDISAFYANPDDLTELGVQFSSQADPVIIANLSEEDQQSSGTVGDHSYTVGSDGRISTRGDSSDNDGYLTTTFNAAYVFKGKSRFYRKKYSWLRNRSGARKSRAKF